MALLCKSMALFPPSLALFFQVFCFVVLIWRFFAQVLHSFFFPRPALLVHQSSLSRAPYVKTRARWRWRRIYVPKDREIDELELIFFFPDKRQKLPKNLRADS